MRFNAWQDSLQYCILGKKVCAKKVNVHTSRKTNNILNNIMKKCSITHIVLNNIVHYAIQRQFLKNQKDAVRLYGDFWTQILEESNMLFAHLCVSLTVALVLAIVHAICHRAVGILIIQKSSGKVALCVIKWMFGMAYYHYLVLACTSQKSANMSSQYVRH